jgi:hypothetical protein
MSIVKHLWESVATKVQQITGKSWEESLDIAEPLTNHILNVGFCTLPDGTRLEITDVKL